MKKYKYILPILRKSLPFILRLPIVRRFTKFAVLFILVCIFIPSHWFTLLFYMIFYGIMGGISFLIAWNIISKIFSSIYNKITSKY